MKWQELATHPAVRRSNRILNVAALLLVAMLVSTHGAYAWQAHAAADNWADRVFIIERDWHFKLLYPLGGGAIGFSLPPLSVAYVNAEAVAHLGTDLQGVRRHEAKHLEQADALGLLQYYRLDEWKREGIAEYARGGPTVDLCAPSPDANPNRLAYRAYYVAVRYLIEVKGLTESEIYAFDQYPLEDAELWLTEEVCS